MNVAFVWDWDNEPIQIWAWQDGIAAMVRELGKKCSVTVYTQIRGITKETVVPHPYFPVHAYPNPETMVEAVQQEKPDVILFWADMTRPAISTLAREYPSAICFAGGEPILENTHLFKSIFTESDVYTERFLSRGIRAQQAFGVNTELFKPKNQPKMFDVFFPACFAAWKRHELFAESVRGLRAAACGWFQDHEPWCYEACQKAGVWTIPHVPSYLLPDFYSASKTVLITSDSTGGSQRSVLEAMACNIPCIVMEDSDKTTEYIRKAGFDSLISTPDAFSIRDKVSFWMDHEPIDTRSWVMENFSEYIYAQKVYDELCLLAS